MIRPVSHPSSAPPAGPAPTREADPARLAETERLGDEIAELAAHIHAATYRLLTLLVEFDRRGGWGGGFRSCAHWLSWRTGIGLGAAREKMRVARALPELPRISQAMERGELSFSKVRALTRVATPENEARLLELARHGTTAHVEQVVRAWRRVDRLEEGALERARHEARALTLYPDEDGSWVLRGRLDPEVGALLRKALDAASEELYRRAAAVDGPATDGSEPDRPDTDGPAAGGPEASGPATGGPDCRQQRADAIGLMAERALAHEGEVRRADRFQVVLHVDEGVLAAGAEHGAEHGAGAGAEHGARADDTAEAAHAVLAESGHRVSAETSRRLSCDASVVRMTHDADGNVLDVGRRTRTVPPAIRRALEHRDRTCRFPGCGVRHTDAHHVTHWADGGETRLDNLVLLCRFHHRAVHEGEVRLEAARSDGSGDAEVRDGETRLGAAVRAGIPGGVPGADAPGVIRFVRSDGRPIPAAPRPPRLPHEPVETLVRRQRDRGVAPDPWTATPDWHGEPLDLGLAIDVLRG